MAQSRLTGTLKDSVNYTSMAYSTVSLIHYADSTLYRFTRTNDKGVFGFENIKHGKYEILITRPGFADFEDIVELKENENKDLGIIQMIEKANLLREVIIREKMNAIRVRGDTTEFLVDSFLVNKNSNVEDLLKKLPGIQVDKTGKITAQGQEVKRVLVDGEEFFGDDPTVATKNIRADNVETVQVFDKKSDQAAFTGIDDGTKEKTINLTLKDDAKKGYFGKVSGSAGTEERYEGQAMFNSFNKKRKFSVYGATSNTNNTSLSWDDADKYTGGKGNSELSEDGYMYTYYNYDDENGDFNGRGIPETWYTGTHYSNKFKADKYGLTLNATHKEMTVSGFDDNYTQSILPDTTFYNSQLKNFNSQRKVNSINGNYTIKLDSLSTMLIKFNARQGSTKSTQLFNSGNYNGDSLLVNSNNRRQESDGTNEMFGTTLTINKKFKRQGRTLSLSLNQNYNANNSDGFLTSETKFFDGTGGVIKQDIIDQRKENDLKVQMYSGKATYTEPLSKTWFVVSDYELSTTINESKRITNSKTNNEYTNFIDTLSSDFKYDIVTHKGGLSMKYATKKLTYSFGGRVAYTDLRQDNRLTDTLLNQKFTNLFPAARISYKLKNTSNISFSYDGSTRQPTLQQIQPVQDNSNPLDIYLGNTNLGQSFRNNLNVSYNSYKPITGRSIYLSVSYTFINNDFTSNDYVDALGRKIHQTVNIDGNESFNFYSYYFYRIKAISVGIGTGLNGYGGKNTNYINQQKNVNEYQSISFGPDISYEKEELIDIGIRTDFKYNRNTSSLRPDAVTSFWIQMYEPYIELMLPKKFVIETSCEFNVRERTSEFDRNLNTTILNASITKKFFSKDQLEVGISGYDLLNQNIGFSRNATSNYINENTYSILKRYVLFTLTWNFTKGPATQN